MKVITVVHGHPSLHKGGGEVAAYALHQMLLEDGHESVFVGWNGRHAAPEVSALERFDTNNYLLNTATEYFHFSSTSSNLEHALELLINKHQPDVIHFHHYIHIGIEAAAVVKRLSPRTKVVLTLHEYLAICANNGQLLTKSNVVCLNSAPKNCVRCFPQHTEASFFMRKMAITSALSYVDHFISPSEFLRDKYIQWGLAESKIHSIENPLPLTVRTVVKPVPLQSDEGVWRLAYFGQVNFYKGLDVVIKAVLEAVEQGKKVQLSIHGNLSNVTGDDFVQGIEKTVKENTEVIEYCGPYEQTDVTDLMAKYHYVVMGSRWFENSPVIIQEAMASGVPMIVPNHGGMREKTKEVGLRYNPSSVASLADTLLALEVDTYQHQVVQLSEKRKQIKEQSRNSYQSIIELYRLNQATDRVALDI